MDWQSSIPVPKFIVLAIYRYPLPPQLFARIDTELTGSISVDQFVAVFSGRPTPASASVDTPTLPAGGAKSAAGFSNTSSLDTALVPSEFIVVHDPPSKPTGTLSRASSVTSSSDPQAGLGVHGVYVP